MVEAANVPPLDRFQILLAADPGVRREDALITLVPVAPEDWSLGNGKAQYVKESP